MPRLIAHVISCTNHLKQITVPSDLTVFGPVLLTMVLVYFYFLTIVDKDKIGRSARFFL